MLDELLDLVFPRRSIRDPMGYWMSEDDWDSIPFQPYCEMRDELFSRGIVKLDRLISSVRYGESDLLQRAIHTLKYRNVPGLSFQLSKILLRSAEHHVHSDVVLVPVPLHYRRLLDRGFNQADLLARNIAQATGLPVRRILWRTRDTGHQARRDRNERIHAMTNTFSVYPYARVPHTVVLIDDIATTGATLDACATALKQRGAMHVDAWVVARG
tara:strand:+ start:997 stop:1638 length:642 start_codon:yes stop_codon:yes gene_type:complete